MLYHVTLEVTTTMTIPIEAADESEAGEIALEMPVEEISDLVHIEEIEIEKKIMAVAEDGPVDDVSDVGEGLYCDRPVDDDDEDIRYPGDQDEQY